MTELRGGGPPVKVEKSLLHLADPAKHSRQSSQKPKRQCLAGAKLIQLNDKGVGGWVRKLREQERSDGLGETSQIERKMSENEIASTLETGGTGKGGRVRPSGL